jgi:hypothetical protein
MRPLLLSFLLLLLVLVSCDEQNAENTSTSEGQTAYSESEAAQRELTAEFKGYWYSGLAEISSYELKQDRYGEMRNGTAVLIFVTEPFDAQEQVKADQEAVSNRSVLKLNATRDFITGIYPYKIMSSTFLPLDRQENAIKVATSIQEWCGHTYMQLNQKGDHYNVMLHSYFQSEGNKEFQVPNVLLENQIPNQLRLNPAKMPVGQIQMIPSTEYLRLSHEETKALTATATLKQDATTYLYTISYESGRTVEYVTDLQFPFQIRSWKEEFPFRGTLATATATLKKTLRTAYWNQNSNKYAVLRDSLAL